MNQEKNTKGLFDLPQQWSWTIANEACESVRDGTHDTPKYIDIGIPLITSKNLKGHKIDFSTAKFISVEEHKQISIRSGVQVGDILFAMIGTVGNPVIVNDEQEFSIKNVGLFKKNESVIKPKFLRYWLLSFLLEKIIEKQKLLKGTTQKFIPLGNLRKLPVPLPPLNEQKRIVTKIEALQTRSTAVKEELEAIKPLLNQFRQSVLASAFRGDLTKDWRKQNPDVEPAEVLLERIRIERRRRWEEAELEKMKAKGKVPKDDKWKKKYKELEPIDTESLPKLPDGWCWVSIKSLGEVKLGRQRSPKHHNGEHMRPYLRAANVFENRIDTSDILQMNFTPEEFKKYELKDRDILLNEGQSKELVGRPAIYSNEIDGCCFQNTLVSFRVYSYLLPEYALDVFRRYMHNGRFQKIAKWTTNIAHLGAERFAKLEFPLPPIKEQKEIVRRIESLFKLADNIEQQYQQAEVDLETLNQSILAKAFRGELVPQDPNDEPASVLLERIKEERDRAKPKETKKKKSSKKKDKQLDIPGI